MTSHRSERMTVAGCGIEILSAGDGPPLLFLHGAGGASRWMPYMERLAERYRLYVPSHPGFGRSDTPGWLDGMGDLAYFYLDFLEEIGEDRLHLVGNSLGGWLALEIAVRSSARLATLTLVSAAGIHLEGVPKGDIFLWDDAERARNTFFDPSLAEARLAAAERADEEESEIALRNHFATAKLAWHPRFYNPELQKWLHRVPVPTLVLWGADDRIFPVAYGEAMQRMIPGAALSVLPECGHLPHQEKPDEFVAAVAAHAGEIAP